jgi:hypothetical protein
MIKALKLLIIFSLILASIVSTDAAVTYYSAPVELGGKLVMRVYAYSKPWADRHAEELILRIHKGIEAGYKPQEIKVVGSGGLYNIYWSTMPLCTVDRFQAKCQKSYPKDLALIWAGKLKQALKEGLVSLSTYNLILPVGDEKDIVLLQGGDPSLTINYDKKILSALISDDYKVLALRGLSAARTEVWLQKEGLTTKISVLVKDWAGDIPDNAYLSVTGKPVMQNILTQGAFEALKGSCLIRKGAQVTLEDDFDFPAFWGGDELKLRVPLSISGPGYLPRTRTLTLNVKNSFLPLQAAEVLMVSNRPEEFKEEGILFEGDCVNHKAFRFMFAHKNANKGKRYLWLSLQNPDTLPAQLLVLCALAGPDRSEIFVGHKANARFLELLGAQNGFVITIPPKGKVNLIDQVLNQNELLSGVLHFQFLSGSNVHLSMQNSKVEGESSSKLIEESFDPFVVHPRGTFIKPEFEVQKEFSTLDREAAVEIGKAPYLLDILTGQPNMGNYGALYNLNFKLNNPGSASEDVGFYFVPSGGLAQASFLVDGKVVEVPTVAAYKERLWGKITLAPAERKEINILTMTEAGSFYPAKILLRILN